LQEANIDPLQFVVGAYGSDHSDRNQLPELAIRRANELTGLRLTGDNTIVIGDTPADILCARAGRAKSVAVASGWHSREDLSRYAPDRLFDDFGDTEAVLQALLKE
jgi:phosphoglycolate phosphatase-like HAD superfamily hydrolase